MTQLNIDGVSILKRVFSVGHCASLTNCPFIFSFCKKIKINIKLFELRPCFVLVCFCSRRCAQSLKWHLETWTQVKVLNFYWLVMTYGTWEVWTPVFSGIIPYNKESIVRLQTVFLVTITKAMTARAELKLICDYLRS